MTTCTPIYQLPVVEGTDRPCDFDDFSCDFTAAVETQLDSLDAIVRRTVTTVPMAWVSSSTPQTKTFAAADPSVTFDAVIVDTDNMVDLTTSNGITIKTPGMYYIWTYVHGTMTTMAGPSGSPSFDTSFFLLSTTDSNANFLPEGETLTYALNDVITLVGSTMAPLLATEAIFPTISGSGQTGDAWTADEIQFGAIWMSDLP